LRRATDYDIIGHCKKIAIFHDGKCAFTVLGGKHSFFSKKCSAEAVHQASLKKESTRGATPLDGGAAIYFDAFQSHLKKVRAAIASVIVSPAGPR